MFEGMGDANPRNVNAAREHCERPEQATGQRNEPLHFSEPLLFDAPQTIIPRFSCGQLPPATRSCVTARNHERTPTASRRVVRGTVAEAAMSSSTPRTRARRSTLRHWPCVTRSRRPPTRCRDREHLARVLLRRDGGAGRLAAHLRRSTDRDGRSRIGVRGAADAGRPTTARRGSRPECHRSWARIFDLAIAATALQAGEPVIYTFDTAVFGRVPGLTVLHP